MPKASPLIKSRPSILMALQTHLPLRKLQESPAATNLSNRHRPDRPPTQMALSTAGPSPSLELLNPALTPDYLTSFLSFLPCSTPDVSRQPSPLTEKVGKRQTSYTLSGKYQSHTYPSLLRSHQTPRGGYPPS